MDAAVVVLERIGIDHFTVVAVAEELGVTQPALYRHVAGYDDLVAKLALDARVRLREVLRDAAVGRSGEDAVRAVAAAWRRFVRDHPQQYAATDRASVARDPRNAAAAQAVVEVLAQVVAGYGLAPGDAERTAWALRSALHGFADLELRHGWPSEHDRDATFERLVDLLVAGLRSE